MNLVVFDIDGTLLRTSGVDDECYAQALRETLGIEGISTDWGAYDLSGGTLQADGYREELATRGTLDFVDASVAGTPTSRLAFDGTVQFGGEAGAVFRQFALRGTRLDLQTVRQSVPAVALPGELRLDGVLNGPVGFHRRFRLGRW